MLLNIKVTTGHIKRGKACKQRNCPVALALQRLLTTFAIMLRLDQTKFVFIL